MTSLIAALFAAITAVTLAPLPATASEPTRVLIVGDSVTHGLRGDYTWRYFAWKSLQQTGASVDFVGPHAGTNGVEPDLFFSGPYADPAFDTDHAARWGMAMQEMLDTPDATSPAIGDLVAASDPDVIVEQLGVNDFDREGLTAGEMVSQVRRFVADARAVKPSVDVVLGSLPQTWIREVSAYNAALPGLAAELSTDASRVVATPVADFVNGVDTYDFAHPTTSGQEKLAFAIVTGLADLGIGSVPIAVEQPAPAPAQAAPSITTPPALSAPATPRKVKAVRDGRTRVTWRSVASAAHYVVRCGRTEQTSTGQRAILRVKARSCSVRSVNAVGVSPWVKVPVRR